MCLVGPTSFARSNVARPNVARQNFDKTHHSTIEMLQNMAVIRESTNNVRVTEIHPQFHTRESERTPIPIRHIHGIKKIPLAGWIIVALE